MEQQIKIPITPTVEGIARIAAFEGFGFWYHSRQKAEMICSVWMVDSEGNIIESIDLNQGRWVRIEISNVNRVTEQGIVIPPDDPNLANGIPEYDFYFGAFMLNPQGTPLDVIVQAMIILNQFNRFDRP
jgi:hypothetical protein